MAETISDIIIPTTNFVSINSLSGISVGSPINLLNKGSSSVRLVESASQPNNDVTDGLIITDLSKNYASVSILTGSSEVWAISADDIDGIISAQEA